MAEYFAMIAVIMYNVSLIHLVAQGDGALLVLVALRCLSCRGFSIFASKN